jgi:hypothetical protein
MGDTTSIRVLNAAIHSLRTQVRPLLPDPAQLQVDHITRMLWLVRARAAVRAEALRRLLTMEADRRTVGSAAGRTA